MQRPLMGPSFLVDDHAPEPESRKKLRVFRLLGMIVWRPIRMTWRVLMYDPLSRRGRLRIEDGSPMQRLIRGIAYRVAFIPVFLAAMVCAIVWWATHPKSAATAADQIPSSLDVYYEPVTFMSSDNVKLEGLLFPALQAKHVVEEKELAIRKRSPAVVLVHDFAATKRQMLPLVRPLHDAGFVVLAMNTRGNGASGAVGHTYGLREALDVKSAVELLRRKSFVDPARIAIVGAGTGATAALIEAQQDPAIAALVLADPLVRGLDAVLDGRLGPPQETLAWLRPLCKWTFEIAYRVDADDLEWSEFADVLEKRPVLMIGEDGKGTDVAKNEHRASVVKFLESTLKDPAQTTAGAQ